MAKANRYGQGSVKAAGRPGTYRIRYGRPGIDQKSETIRAETLTEARAICAEKAAANRRRSGLDPAARTVSDLLDAWQANGDFRPASVRTNKARAKVIAADLGHYPLADLTTADLDRTYRQWTAEGKSAGSVRSLHSTIRAALHQASVWGWPTEAVAANVRLPRVTTKVEAIPADDLAVILAAARAKGGKVGTLVAILAATGCRLGEALGLQWADVTDGARPQVHIRRQRTPQGIGPAKTASGHRSIDISTDLAEALLAAQGSPDAPVVDWSPQAADKVFAALVKSCGFVRPDGRALYTCHQVRHNVADHLVLDLGVPVPDAARVLGHSDGGALLLRTYSSRLGAASRPRVVVGL